MSAEMIAEVVADLRAHRTHHPAATDEAGILYEQLAGPTTGPTIFVAGHAEHYDDPDYVTRAWNGPEGESSTP